MVQTYSTIEMLEKLVSFDTTSRNTNIPLIAFVEEYLESHGIPSLRVDYEEDKKTNLYATIGPDIEGGIVLSGHTDVVPVDGQEWSSDPFEAVERDGKIFGRGTCDMKGFLAVALAMVPQFKSANLKTPIHFALSCDEEVSCMGVRPLLKYMKDNLPKPKAVIVGEPTSMRVVNAHKGGNMYSTCVHGHEGHSSNTHLGVNAIMVTGEIISELNRCREDMIRKGDPSGRFDPPYTTVHVGVINGGTANNIIPNRCEMFWETRLLPDQDGREIPDRIEKLSRKLEPAMKEVFPGSGIETSLKSSVPGLAPQEDSPAELLALRLAEANGAEAVSYATEAGLFQEIGLPAVICGPGSIEQAHKPDEYVEISQLEKCEAFMQRLTTHCVEQG